MKIHHFSDIHLEMNSYPGFLRKMPGGDVLIMNGDIHCARFFKEGANDSQARGAKKCMLKMAKEVFPKYDKVYHIMGNHEHYGYNILDSVNTFRKFYEANNIPVEILDDNLIILNDDYCLIGGTLWTDFNRNNPNDKFLVQNSMNDFKIIYTQDKAKHQSIFTPDEAIVLFDNTVNFIKLSLLNFPDKKFIVATHHAPSFTSEGRRISGISAGYCSNLDDFILDNSQIEYWIHGHTHTPVEYDIGNCKIRTAMFGYEYYEPHLKNNFKLGEFDI